MREIFDRYMNYLRAERNASPYTLRNYSTDLWGTYSQGEGKGFFQFLVSKKINDYREVDRQILRDFLSWLVDQGINKSSLARKLSAIRSFYRFLLREGILEKSPIPINAAGRKGDRSLMSPKLDKKLPVFLTRPEMEDMLSRPDISKPSGKRDSAILELLYASGLRVMMPNFMLNGQSLNESFRMMLRVCTLKSSDENSATI